MKLQESGEMYLETIYVLSKSKDMVRSIDIATEMNYSKPSISRAMGILKENNLIEISPSGAITLTEEGLQIATKTYERHEVLMECFIKLGVDEQTAEDDACKIEHVISDVTFDAIKKILPKLP